MGEFMQSIIKTRRDNFVSGATLSEPLQGRPQRIVHTIFRERSWLCYPHAPTQIVCNERINWPLIVLGGGITILPYVDWYLQLLHRLGMHKTARKIKRFHEDQE